MSETVRRPMRSVFVGVCGVLLGACATPATDHTAAAGASDRAALIGACCGTDWEDSTFYSRMRLYEATPEASRSPELAMLPYRMTSGITRRDRIVIQDSAAWARVWPELVGSHSPKPVLPRVDFSRELIVIASMGQRSSGGYSISIDSALVKGDTITLAVTEQSPGPRCGTTAALSSPVALARVRRPPVPIRFLERTTVIACD
jgi:hypothetical protein